MIKPIWRCPLDWSLCIATLDRRDALLRSIRHALAQTVLPREIVVIDVSDDWEETARILREDIMAGYPEVEFFYGTSPVRSLTVQRNIAINQCRSEIIFLLDDDSFMFPDCAEEIMKVYEADKLDEVVAVAISLDENIPALPGAEAGKIIHKVSTEHSTVGLQKRVMRYSWGRWVNRKILLQNADELFIKYEGPRPEMVPAAVAALNVHPTTFMQGCTMTVRREIALREPFEPAFRYYAASEDLDASYRFGRHGAVLRAERARLHHFEAAGGRLKRKKVIAFQILNGSFIIKRNARDPHRFKTAFRILIWRRLIGEVLKDALARRYRFPQVQGVLTGMKLWRQVWQRSPEELETWYPDFQKKVLEEL